MQTNSNKVCGLQMKMSFVVRRIGLPFSFIFIFLVVSFAEVGLFSFILSARLSFITKWRRGEKKMLVVERKQRRQRVSKWFAIFQVEENIKKCSTFVFFHSLTWSPSFPFVSRHNKRNRKKWKVLWREYSKRKSVCSFGSFARLFETKVFCVFPIFCWSEKLNK